MSRARRYSDRVSRRRREALETVAAELRGTRASETAIVVRYVASEASAARVACGARETAGGRIDIVVDNAADSRPLKGEESEVFRDEARARTFASARRVTKPLVSPMKAAGFGRIIGITGPQDGQTVTDAGPSMAALLGSRMLSLELVPAGITVSGVGRGRITSVQILERPHPTEEPRRDDIRRNIAAGRCGVPEDLGALVALRASPLARYISGSSIPVDGGAVRGGV